jgi:hypothetical protein
MAKVIQEIPDGRFCAKLSKTSNNANEKCIFLDRDDNNNLFMRRLEGFTCRRHLNVILGMEINTDTDMVVKCHSCQTEVTGGDIDAETGTYE